MKRFYKSILIILGSTMYFTGIARAEESLSCNIYFSHGNQSSLNFQHPGSSKSFDLGNDYSLTVMQYLSNLKIQILKRGEQTNGIDLTYTGDLIFYDKNSGITIHCD